VADVVAACDKLLRERVGGLVQAVRASGLMGASVIITGLSAEIAQTLVNLGVDLSMMQSVGDLQGGIERRSVSFATPSPEPLTSHGTATRRGIPACQSRSSSSAST
jgi:hypothetical protein